MYNLDMGTNRHKGIWRLLPSKDYIMLYLWSFCLICAMLAGISILLGQYLGYDLAALGLGAVFLMLLVAFAGALGAGVLLQIIDREP